MAALEAEPHLRFREASGFIRVRALGEIPLAQRMLAHSNAGGSPGEAEAFVRVNADIGVGAYLERPYGRVPVTVGMLEKWGATMSHVFDAALRNVKRLAPVTQVGSVGYLNDPSSIARLLLQPYLAQGIFASVHQPMAIIPTEDDMFLVDASHPDSRAEAASLAVDALDAEAAREVSRTPIAPTPAGWLGLSLPELPQEAQLRRRVDAARYASALPELDVMHRRLGYTTIDVAPYRLAEAQGGAPHGPSQTVLPESPGRRTYLPLADQLLLTRGQESKTIPLQRLLDLPGAAAPVQRLLPQYVAVDRFPEELWNERPSSAPGGWSSP